jgi:ribosomal protein S18 acetylase RimI-like enzyme
MELYRSTEYAVVVSVNVERRVVGPGDDELVTEAWDLKERTRRNDDVLKQRKGFFTNAYRRSTVNLLVRPPEEEIIGFAAVRRDGYLLFLAVAEEHRGEGFGADLVGAAAEAHETVTCHARSTNEDAIRFYEHLGFETERRVENYYEDGGAAYYLTLGDGRESLRERLTSHLF